MKKFCLIAFLALTLTTQAYADHGYRGHGDHWRHDGDWGGTWIVPALIGGAILYGITQSQPVYSQPAPVYVPGPEAEVPAPAPAPAPVWYYCPSSHAYYPYVSTCATPWQTVPATPPPR